MQADDVALRRASCRASKGELEAVLARRGDARRVRVAAPGRGVAGGARRARPASGPVAVCRELTKLHEEVVRGTAAELAERYAAEQVPRGEVVLVIGRRAAGAARPRGRRSTRCAGWSRRARARGRRRASWPGSPALPANDALRALPSPARS